MDNAKYVSIEEKAKLIPFSDTTVFNPLYKQNYGQEPKICGKPITLRERPGAW